MQRQNKYFKAFLIFVFFYWFIDAPVDGLLSILAQLFDIEALQNPVHWIRIVSSLIIIAVGIFYAAKRIRTDKPWKMTPIRKSLVFGIIYYTVQIWWITFSFAFHSGNASTVFVYLYSAMSHVVRFPGIYFSESLGQAELFLNCIFWGIAFYISLLITSKIKSRKFLVRGN
jgi:hypothetical protein